MKTQTINIRKDFSINPSGRTLSDGPFSGESLRKNLLEPAIRKNQKIKVELDDVVGYSSCFLDEAFAGLIRNKTLNYQQFHKIFKIITNNKALILIINKHLLNSGNKKDIN